MHAVVVDPSRVVLRLLSELITERRDTVTACQDSAAALRLLKSDPSVDVLITSLEVHPIGGLELCWEARIAMAAQRPLYIVVMSSRSDDHRLTEALDCGADDLIAKPVRRLELHARLRQAARLASAQLHLAQLGDTDALTGVCNRRAFFQRLNAALLNKAETGISVILLDIDHFKRINDTYGHDIGDLVICRVAAEAAEHARLVGRLGGEEFAILVEGGSETEAFRLADELRRIYAGIPFTADGRSFGTTCSFGISRWIEGEPVDHMIKRADIALYQAKNAGRNCVRWSA